MAELETQRLDKWLWAARFFKTRQLACEAINGGKVHLNGQRSKPGKTIKPGNQLTIHKGSYEWQITINSLSKQRLSASLAVDLYEESEESHARRQEAVARIRAEKAANAVPKSARPDKKSRRLIHRFKQAL